MAANFLADARDRRHGGATGERAPITYRHLLSAQAMTTANPLRVVAHCDIDAAYAQFEMVRLGVPDDQPLCVQQWTGLIAINYPARKFGITRHMDVMEARKKCPNLQTVHVATFKEGETEPGYWGEVDPKKHKVSLDPYRRESAKILAIFKQMVPEGETEKASIDEAYLDLSLLTVQEILRRQPELATVPADAPLGLDTPLPAPPKIDWAQAGNVVPLDGQKRDEGGGEDAVKAEEEEEKIKESLEEEVDGWGDVALAIGAELMGKIRAEVRSKLGYTCSAGIAHNKTLAKLCSAWRKPNAQTVLRQAAVPAFLNPMPFSKIRNLGGKLGGAIATEYGANTVGDMLSVPLEEMQRRFGEDSIWVWNILRGIDHTPVKERTATKSMLASKNINPPVTTREAGYHWLTILAGELYVRLRDARDITEGLWPKTLVLGTRQGYETGRSRQTAFPFTRNLTIDYIAKYAFRLWDEVSEPMTRPTKSKSAALSFNNVSSSSDTRWSLANVAHQLAISFANLERLEGGQKGIEAFLGKGVTKRERSASAGPSDLNKQPAKKLKEDEVIDITDDVDDVDDGESWACPRCNKSVSTDSQARLAVLKQEHEDMHVAKDLHRSGLSDMTATTTTTKSRNTKSTAKKKPKEKGIRAFFSKHP